MIYLIGAGGHAKVILEILEQRDIEIGGLVDNNPELTSLLGYRVAYELPGIFDPNDDFVIVSIGKNEIRKKVVNSNFYKYLTAIHQNSNISTRSTIGNGSVVMAGVTINSSVKIGAHTIINTNASIDHDCLIEDFVHISPNVALGGDVRIGEGAHIGIGASIIQGVIIGKWATIGAGSVIIKDIPDYAVVVGVPGKIIKYKKQNAE